MANQKKRANEDKPEVSAKKTKNDLLKGVDIQAIMNAKGPVVKCVLLKADGAIEEVTVDMTPAKQEVKAILGGACNFLGQYEDIEVFLMCNPDVQENEDVPVTSQKMQPPFHGRLGQIRGDILVFRTDSNGEQQHFTVDEYKKFLATEVPEWEPEEDDDDSEDEENEADEAGYKKAALAYFIEEFVEENKRQPTEEELAEIEQKVEEEMGGDDEGDDDPRVAALEYVVAEFLEAHGREPDEEEMANLKERVEEEMNKLVVDEDYEEGGEVEDIGELIKELYNEALARYENEHGKEPEEETKEAILKNVTRIALTLQGDDQEVDDDEDEDDDEGDEEEGDEEEGDEEE
ncbi:Aste57867_11436 [Aphanomyces stellatus]|uniref:Aste57867_11436 protein n=1 Tax=Aphanomyces stellatus TaxID=120398 RepID=A0A485KT21_9STRA|nr:hypothetical protein As57867_011394 [Aphanomyces stellatus]VFT88297.1 Aste57867_11436 [Aphanomyces stellatus]